MATQASINAVATVFQNVFGRAPSSQESTGWANQLDGGATSAQLASVLANSPEGAALVSGFYQQILGRSSAAVSASEVAGGQAYLAQGSANGAANLRHSIAFSAEAQADIKAVYQTVLGRAASAAEVTASETALANGATLAQLYSSAASSAELTTNLTAAYQTAFGAAPPSAVVTFLQQQIAGGAAFSQLAAALTSLAGGSGGGTGTPVAAQITSATQDPAGTGYVDISGTGQPGASVSASVSVFGRTITSPFAVATVNSGGTWSVTNAPGSGGPGAGIAIPNGTYTVTPIETVNGQTLNGTATSITVSGSGVSIPDTFNPAESMVAGDLSGSASEATAPASAAAGAASLVQLTNPATVGIVPTLNAG